jgi:hypothetical protein
LFAGETKSPEFAIIFPLPPAWLITAAVPTYQYTLLGLPTPFKI